MWHARMVPVSLGLIGWLMAGCVDVGDRVDDLVDAAGSLRSDAAESGEDAAFCLALARTATAVESGSPTTAEEAAEEALARAPEELIDETREVTDRLRDVRDRGAGVRDEDLAARIGQLVEAAREVCDPR